MQMIMHTNAIMEVNTEYMIGCIQSLSVQRLFQCDQCERQQSVNDFESYTLNNQWAVLSHCSKADVEVGVIAKKVNDTLVATS